MQKTNTTVMEIRNIVGKLVAKYYPAMGRIEIWQKGKRTVITVPIGTPVQTYNEDEIFIK